MPYFKTPDQSLHFLSDPSYAYLLPAGAVPISDAEAAALQAPPPAPTAPQSVTPVQAFTALDQVGKLAPLLDYLNQPTTPPLVKAVVMGATEWRRDSLMLMAVAIVLGLSSAQVDDLFVSAAAIEV